MGHYKNLIKPYVFWSFLLIVVPLLLIVLYSVTAGDNSVLTIHFTLDNFKKISDPVYLNVFIKSLKMGLITTGICVVFAYPMFTGKFINSEKKVNLYMMPLRK